MSLKNTCHTIRLLALVSTALFTVSCWDLNYQQQSPQGNSADYSAYEGEAWTKSSTASPYFMRDDSPSTSFGTAGIYSYAHNAKGQRFPLPPGENRGTFQTSRGTVIGFSLGIHVLPSGGLYSFIYIGDFTDWDNKEGWSYETRDRGTYTLDRRSGGPLQISIMGGPSGTKIEIVADGETMRVSLDDLYRWRKRKAQDWRTSQVHIGPETYVIIGSAVEVDSSSGSGNSFGAGNAFFKVSALLEENDRLEPSYGALFVAGARRERVADRIPLGDSGYDLVWDPASGIYIIRGFGTEARMSDESGVADRVFVASKPGVVKIESGGYEGTGFVVNSINGFVLTNSHCAIEDTVIVKFVDGFQTAGRVIDRDTSLDLALIRIERRPSNIRELLFARSDGSVGQEVIFIGHPAGYEWSLSAARIAALRSDPSGRLLQLDGPINPGNSGGPVLDKQGAVIGVVFGRRELTEDKRVVQNIGWAVAASEAQKFINRKR